MDQKTIAYIVNSEEFQKAQSDVRSWFHLDVPSCQECALDVPLMDLVQFIESCIKE